MATMTQDWTDGRIDDFAQRVDNGFAQVDRRFEQVDARFAQVDRRFEQVDARFEQVDRRFEQVYEEQRELRIALERNSREGREELATAVSELRGEIKALGDGLNQRFDGMQQTLIRASFAAIFTLVAGIITLIATQIS